jgi:hypothetical protein
VNETFHMSSRMRSAPTSTPAMPEVVVVGRNSVRFAVKPGRMLPLGFVVASYTERFVLPNGLTWVYWKNGSEPAL